MKAHKLGQTVALLLWVFACNIPDVCKTDDDCPSHAFCYSGEKAKAGDRGICVSKEPVYKEPVIHSFSPLEAAHGAILRIQGEGFSSNPSENSVTLNGVSAEVLFASSNTIGIQVPKNMRCAGPIQVRTGEGVATSTSSFLYLPTATVSTFAGNGTTEFKDGIGTEAQFYFPNNLALNSEGTLYVTDTNNNRVRKISPETREVTTVTHSGGVCLKGQSTGMHCPNGLAIDAQDKLYVAYYFSHRIQTFLPNGEEERAFAGSNTQGFLDANGTDARFDHPDGIVLDKAGNLYVADSHNHRIRKITQEGEVSTFAGSGEVGENNGDYADGPENTARFNKPNGITIDAEAHLYVSDAGNNCIRKVLPDGSVHTLAGCGKASFLDGPGNVACFHSPQGMAMDGRNGYLYVSDSYNHRIRMLTPTGEVRTLAGGGITGTLDAQKLSANHVNGIGGDARFYNPHGIVMDAEGNLYVADSSNHRIRKIVLE